MNNEKFTLRTVSDLVSVVLLVTFIVSGLSWGLKLENRYDALDLRLRIIESDVASITAEVDEGVLPLARERIDAIKKEIESLKLDINKK